MAEASHIIEIENLGKSYRLGGQERRFRTFREEIVRLFSKPFRRRTTAPSDEFWALRHASMTVDEGQIVGIIGPNGAGKSTLLKILSRVTRPTEGCVRLFGRVGSLLEVGTGFHQELTGRENIHLSGAILGMSKAEIRARFDEIVAFSEIEEFLDTPVKHYSSGMYVRLAFAVAAHLDPEILLVDEVLAVGDAAFQNKCLGKMGEVAGSGRTVLFVSHNMSAVQSLCHRAVLIEGGRIVEQGDPSMICANYLQGSLAAPNRERHGFYSVSRDALESQRSEGFRFTSIELASPGGADLGPVSGDSLSIRLRYRAERQFRSGAFWISVRTRRGIEVLRLSTMPISGFSIEALYGEGEVELAIDALPLVGGTYEVDVAFVREQVEWISRMPGVVTFEVQAADAYRSGLPIDQSRGLVVVPHRWRHHERLRSR